jgi:hypothetical protein
MKQLDVPMKQLDVARLQHETQVDGDGTTHGQIYQPNSVKARVSTQEPLKRFTNPCGVIKCQALSCNSNDRSKAEGNLHLGQQNQVHSGKSSWVGQPMDSAQCTGFGGSGIRACVASSSPQKVPLFAQRLVTYKAAAAAAAAAKRPAQRAAARMATLTRRVIRFWSTPLISVAGHASRTEARNNVRQQQNHETRKDQSCGVRCESSGEKAPTSQEDRVKQRQSEPI